MAKKRIPPKIDWLVKKYSQRLYYQEKVPISRVIVFGSQISGKAHKWSDIDVCIISPKFNDPLKAMEFLLVKRNRQEVLAGLEPVGFSDKDFTSDSTFINEVKRAGVESRWLEK